MWNWIISTHKKRYVRPIYCSYSTSKGKECIILGKLVMLREVVWINWFDDVGCHLIDSIQHPVKISIHSSVATNHPIVDAPHGMTTCHGVQKHSNCFHRTYLIGTMQVVPAHKEIVESVNLVRSHPKHVMALLWVVHCFHNPLHARLLRYPSWCSCAYIPLKSISQQLHNCFILLACVSIFRPWSVPWGGAHPGRSWNGKLL